MSNTMQEDQFPRRVAIFDAHCHPTDTLDSLQNVLGMRANVLTVMATRAQDQELVAKAADQFGVSAHDVDNPRFDWSAVHKIIPAFGWHPWFSHQMFDDSEYEGVSKLSEEQKRVHYQKVLTPKPDDDTFLANLPEPRPLSEFIEQTRGFLTRYPLALVGEIGLDRSFRIPHAWLPEQVNERDDALTPGGREGRKLSPYRVDIVHQKKVLSNQLRLAGEMGRAVSVHGVAAHGTVYETVAETWKGHERVKSNRRKKQTSKEVPASPADTTILDTQETSHPPKARPFPPRICLHSFSGPAETVKQYLSTSTPCDIFFSFSTTINSWSEDGNGKVEEAVRTVPDDRLLMESDLHTAGDRMDGYLEDIARKLCEVKGWSLEDGLVTLANNWKRFVFGHE